MLRKLAFTAFGECVCVRVCTCENVCVCGSLSSVWRAPLDGQLWSVAAVGRAKTAQHDENS